MIIKLLKKQCFLAIMMYFRVKNFFMLLKQFQISFFYNIQKMNRILITCFVIRACTQLCDPDFQQKRPSGYFISVTSDINCWYTKSMGNLQVFYYSKISTVVDLWTGHKQYYCQRITLIPGKKYLLGYDVFVSPNINHVNLQTYVNQILKSEFLIKDSNSFGSNQFVFMANATLNQLCFSDNHYYDESIPVSSYGYFGALLDNITLNEVIVSQIEFQVKSFEKSLELISNCTYKEEIVLEMKNRYNIEIVGQTQLIGIQYTQDEDNLLVVKAQLPQIIQQAQIEFVKNLYFQQNKLYEYEIIINSSYYNPNNNSNTGLLYLQKEWKTHPAVQVFGSFIKYLIEFIQLTVCSYFILSLIGFWNVSLLYIFLQINVVPQYVRRIYEKLIQILTEDANVLKMLGLFFDFFQKQINFSIESQIRELLPLYVQDLTWFGNFGVSSKVAKNNLEILIILGLLFIKIIVIKLLVRIIQIKSNRKLKISFNFTLVILTEFIVTIPFLVISAGSCIQNSMYIYKETFEKKFQIILCFFSLLSFAFLMILGIKSQKQKSSQTNCQIKNIQQQNNVKEIREIRKSSEKKEKIKKIKTYGQYQDQAIANLHILLIPFLLILFPKQVFLVTVLLFFIFRMVYYLRVKVINPYEKTYLVMINIIWIVHHCGFLSFYVISKVNQHNYLNHEVPYVEEIGVLVLGALFVGGSIEILKAMIEFIGFFYKIIQRSLIKYPIYPKIKRKKSDKALQTEQTQKTSQTLLSMIKPIKTGQKNLQNNQKKKEITNIFQYFQKTNQESNIRISYL